MTDPSVAPTHRPRPSVPDLLVALGVLLLGGLLLAGTLQIPFGINAVVGPRAFPLIVSAGTLLLGLALLVSALQGHRAEPAVEEDTDPTQPADLRPAALILGGFLLGAALLQPLGFVLGTALMYASVGYAYGERRLPLLIGVALTVALLTYVVFTRGLGLSLPPGLLNGVL
ncbi:tripartite tricarboxylate transporter TctB family protein [Deinococcus aquaedulcis]|uniref:tripartite tricarboxylate transporter TctB family protein n=1 Tax=Deinococcus aquaedulcis TaxID=2840455 RepID=UPI001C83ACC1|nr:tripartite tricarboxylate transporter TctB family protein [Deinococcus aquaedulcis]